MVEHSFTNVSIHGCLSKSSSFYLEQQQQQQQQQRHQVEVNDLKAAVSNELSNLTPTGSPDDEDEYSPQNLRRKSSSSLFFNTKLQESLNSMNQQQKNPIFQLGQDEDEDDEDDDYYDDYSDRICKELSIDQEFNYTLDRIDSNNSISRLMLNTEIKSLKISTTTTTTTTTTAPIDMRKATPVCTDIDDQALSSTLKETSNMVISSSSGSSSGGDTNVVGKNIESGKAKVKKNNRKRRQKKQQQSESPKTKEAVQKAESLPVDFKKPTNSSSKQIESPLQDEDIFAGFPGQGFEFYLDDDIDSDGCLNDHHTLSEEADKPSILINKHHGSFKKAKKAFIASELELDDPAYTTNDEDSSSADYFLASSVDTVIMAPYLRAANFGRVAADSSSLAVPAISTCSAAAPVVFGKEPLEMGHPAAPYTSSIANNFLYSLEKSSNHVNNNNNSNKFSKHHEANNSIPNSFNPNSQNSKGSFNFSCHNCFEISTP